MIGIYQTTNSGRKTGLAGQYTNEVRIKEPIYFQTSESGSNRIKQSNKRTLITGVSGVVVDTDSGNISGMSEITYNPFDLGYFHLMGDDREIVSASEVYFNTTEDGIWGIYVKDPIFK